MSELLYTHKTKGSLYVIKGVAKPAGSLDFTVVVYADFHTNELFARKLEEWDERMEAQPREKRYPRMRKGRNTL